MALLPSAGPPSHNALSSIDNGLPNYSLVGWGSAGALRAMRAIHVPKVRLTSVIALDGTLSPTQTGEDRVVGNPITLSSTVCTLLRC